MYQQRELDGEQAFLRCDDSLSSEEGNVSVSLRALIIERFVRSAKICLLSRRRFGETKPVLRSNDDQTRICQGMTKLT